MNQVRPARWRAWTAVLAALALVAAACGGSDDDESADDATTTVDVEVDDTTTSSMPATTTTLSEADRFRTIAVDLWTARNDLYQNPPADPESSLAEIFDRQCDCFQFEVDVLTEIIGQGGRFSGPPALPLGVRFAGYDAESRTGLVHMALDASPRQLLADDGSVIDEFAGSDEFAIALGLIEREGNWLIDVTAEMQVDAAFVDGLITEGLP